MDTSSITRISKWVQILMMILSAVANIVPNLVSKVMWKRTYRKKR